MKATPGILFVMALACMLPCIAHADNSSDPDLNISCVTHRADQKTAPGNDFGTVTTTKEDWDYVVNIENTTLDDIKNLEIKYIIFFKQEQLGSLAPAHLGRQPGDSKIDVIKGHDKAEFHTVKVALEKASLAANRYYLNGAKNDANANLAGIWVRIYQNGNLIAEISRPPALLDKEKWDQ